MSPSRFPFLRRCALPLCAGFTAVLAPCVAQAAPRAAVSGVRVAQRPSAASGQARTSRYVLGAGDEIKVSVKDYPEFDVAGVTVAPDGVVGLPFYGTVRVGGKTTAQVEEQLRQILTRELKQPRVSVSITKFRDPTVGRVYLLGSVASPGPIDIREGFRLTEVLAAAGGLGGRLDEKSATLTRAGQSAIRLNLAAALAQPNSAANIRLRANDILTITAIPAGRIVITGDVAQPGAFEIHRDPQPAAREIGPNPRLSDIILAAGGLGRVGVGSSTSGAESVSAGAGSSGSTNGVGGAQQGRTLGLISSSAQRFSGFLQRGGQRIDLNITEALRDVSGIYNIPLRSGDFITVEAVLPPAPVAPIKVYVNGFVGRVGPLQVPPGTRLLQVLVEAGGLTKTPDKVVTTIRRGRQGIAINLPAVLLNADSDANIELKEDDVVSIDEPPVMRVRAAGSLTSPGELRLRPGATLLDALLEAGNLNIKPEDARLNVLRREEDGSQRIISADAAPLLELRSVKDNIVLREGDLVNVSPIRLQTVFVLGQVANPGAIEVRDGEGLIEVLTRAGGARENAALTKIAVERNGQTLSVDALDALKFGRPLDFKMQAGDKVVVPENLNRVLVLEAVAKPGPIAIPERGQLTLAQALAEAGGPSQNTKEIVLVRRENGVLRETKYPIKQVRSGAAGQQVLRPSDAIYVPATVAKQGLLQSIGSTLGLLSFFVR